MAQYYRYDQDKEDLIHLARASSPLGIVQRSTVALGNTVRSAHVCIGLNLGRPLCVILAIKKRGDFSRYF